MVTINASRRATLRFPLWLSRLHSWWFAGQVLVNLVAAWFIIRMVSDTDWTELGIGLLLGQGFLLSVWLALGGLSNVARFVSVLLVTLTAALAIGHQAETHPNLASWLVQSSEVFIVCFFMVLVFHGLLLPLRWLLGWRLDFDPAYHSREKAGRYQFGTAHFLGWTTFLAIPCGLVRLMPRDDLGEIVTTCLAVSAMTLPIAASISFAMVSPKKWRWMIAAAAILGITLVVELSFPMLVITENFLQFNLGIVTAVGGNLLALRCFGLKLFSVIEQPVSASATQEFSENPVKPPHFHVQSTRQWAEVNAGS